MKVDPATKKKIVDIGKMIRAAREGTGLSQAALAKKIEMARENYIRIENGRANLTVETMMRIAIGLGGDLVIRITGGKKKSAPEKR